MMCPSTPHQAAIGLKIELQKLTAVLYFSFLFELQKLCDAVPAYPTKAAIEVIEAELGAKVGDLFQDFTADTR